MQYCILAIVAYNLLHDCPTTVLPIRSCRNETEQYHQHTCNSHSIAKEYKMHSVLNIASVHLTISCVLPYTNHLSLSKLTVSYTRTFTITSTITRISRIRMLVHHQRYVTYQSIYTSKHAIVVLFNENSKQSVNKPIICNKCTGCVNRIVLTCTSDMSCGGHRDAWVRQRST